MRKSSIVAVIASAAALCGWNSIAQAAAINFSGLNTSSSGTGFGHVLSVLALQDANPGADNLETGSVLWNGSKDVYGTVGSGIDTKTQLSQTRTVAEMTAQGINASNLALVFNLAQAGSSDALNLHDFTIRFQNAAGATLFDATFDDSNVANAATNALTTTGQGIGSSGYEFRVNFSGSEGTNFFASSTNRIGMFVTSANAMSNATGGMETFYVAPAVPEPTSAALATLGTMGFGLLRNRRGTVRKG